MTRTCAKQTRGGELDVARWIAAALWSFLLAAFAADARAEPDEPTVPSLSATRPRVALVLSGGGARGLAHIGLLKVLDELPIPFAPFELRRQVLVDGGLVRNLPTDIARSMGAEIVIAVNVGTPLTPSERLTDLLAVTEQMVNILTEQNVERSLADLRASSPGQAPGSARFPCSSPRIRSSARYILSLARPLAAVRRST